MKKKGKKILVKLPPTRTVAKVEAKRETFLYVNIVVEKVILVSMTEEGPMQNVANAINQDMML